MSRYSITAFWLATALGLSVRTICPFPQGVWQVGMSRGIASICPVRGLGAHTSARQMRHDATTLNPSCQQ